MTKLSIVLASTMLSVSFVPAASAYSFAPEEADVVPMAVSAPQTAKIEGVCTMAITPLLAGILALPDDWRGATGGSLQTALACAEE